jgi:oligosaccharyltransferase complex subunit beta
MKILNLFVFIAILAASASAVEKKETLVLLDNLAIRETHSIFFKNLQGKPFIKGQLIENEN